MSTAAQILAANGILRADEVVELAEKIGLDLAAAATMLQKESGGGANIWGHDRVPTAGTYVNGAPVTEFAYNAYLKAVHAGKAGRQGVGPTQLTYGPYQDQADAIGGCWSWRPNVTIGFTALRDSIRSKGLRIGFRTYNGGPTPNAQSEHYADESMALYKAWSIRLAAGVTPVQWVDLEASLPLLSEGDGYPPQWWIKDPPLLPGDPRADLPVPPAPPASPTTPSLPVPAPTAAPTGAGWLTRLIDLIARWLR